MEESPGLRSPRLQKRNRADNQDKMKVQSMEDPFLQDDHDNIPLVGPMQMISFASDVDLSIDEDTSISSSSSEDEYETESSSDDSETSSSSESRSESHHKKRSDESASKSNTSIPLNDKNGASKAADPALDHYETDTTKAEDRNEKKQEIGYNRTSSVEFETDSQQDPDQNQKLKSLPPAKDQTDEYKMENDESGDKMANDHDSVAGERSHRSDQEYETEKDVIVDRSDDDYETDGDGSVKQKMRAVIQQISKTPKTPYDSSDDEYETDGDGSMNKKTQIPKTAYAGFDDEYETDGDGSVKQKRNAVVRQIPSRTYNSDSDSSYSSDRPHGKESNRRQTVVLSDASSSVDYTDDEEESEGSSASDSEELIMTPMTPSTPYNPDDDSSDGYEFDDELHLLIDSSDDSSASSAQFTDDSEEIESDREYYEKLDTITRREDQLAARSQRVQQKCYIASAAICCLALGLILLFIVDPLKKGFLGDGDGRRLRGSMKHT
jgi:hypothetical protein